MSLATSGGVGGGLGGGGMSMSTMAHGGPSALATHQQMQPPPGTSSIPGAGATAPPVSAAALGADLLDKNQGSLDKRSIRSVSHMPIVAIDLYGDDGHVASYPPSDDAAENMDKSDMSLLCTSVGQLQNTDVMLKKDNDVAYKIVRRVLKNNKGYQALFDQAMAKSGDDDEATTTISSPHLLLGYRNVKQLLMASSTLDIQSQYSIDDDTAAIAPSNEKSRVTIRNGSLDGTSTPQGDDFDRVTLQVPLHSSKKPLSLLPEDAVGLLLAKAKSMVSTVEDKEEEQYLEYPPAIAVPAWASRDASIESLLDACQNNNGATTIYQRGVAALAGALLPQKASAKEKKEQKKSLLMHSTIKSIYTRIENNQKKQQELAQKGEENARSGETFMPTVVLAGMTSHGIELTAIQVGNFHNATNVEEIHCIFQDFKVLSNVSYAFDTKAKNPSKLIHKALVQLSEVVDDIYPELEEDGGIVNFITYGTITSQLKMKEALTASLKLINKDEKDEVWNEGVTFASTREETVALGTAVLAASSHARIRTVQNNKPRAGLNVLNVAPNAVGISVSFDGQKWTPVKTIFEYDRLVPAGPHAIELTASESVALQQNPELFFDYEKLVEEGNKFNTAKYIQQREEAARSFQLKIVQQLQRNGEWIQVGTSLQPLTVEGNNDSDKEDVASRIAIENSILELSLSPSGIITSSLATDG